MISRLGLGLVILLLLMLREGVTGKRFLVSLLEKVGRKGSWPRFGVRVVTAPPEMLRREGVGVASKVSN